MLPSTPVVSPDGPSKNTFDGWRRLLLVGSLLIVSLFLLGGSFVFAARYAYHLTHHTNPTVAKDTPSVASASTTETKKHNPGKSKTKTTTPVTTPTTTTDPSKPPSSIDKAAPSASSPSAPSVPSDPTPPSTDCAHTPHSCGFPDGTNTGPVGCSSYTNMSGNITINTDNTVINCVRMTGSFDVYANNVTIENSIITTSNWWGVNQRVNYGGLKVLHNTITGNVGHGPDNGGEDYGFSNSGTNVEAGWNNISEFGAAISTSNGNIHDNYGHDNQPFIPYCGSDANDNPIICNYYVHSDPFISSGNDTGGLTIRHNTLFDPETTEMGASASIGLFADDGPVSNTTVDNNLIAGGAYCIYPGGGSTSSNIVITNNHFSTLYWANCGVYGPDATSYWHTGSGNTWSGNVWADGPNAGQTVDP